MADQSVICIHPVVEERGKVKSEEDNAFRVTLKDCLACSGCAITEDELSLLAHQDPTNILESLRDHPGFHTIVSTAAVANLAASRNISIQEAFGAIASYAKSLGGSKVVSDGIWQMVWRNLLINDFKKNSLNKRPYIIARCPGAVMFFERKTKFADLLSPIKPYPQLYAIHAKHCAEKPAPYVLSITPCYDRKLETGRFEGDVDSSLTIGEISNKIEAGEPLPTEITALCDVEYMIRTISGEDSISIQKTGQTTVYSSSSVKGASVCGESALRRLVTNIEKGKCNFDIVEADLCPISCYSGGGLVRGETPRSRKELVAKTISIHDEYALTKTNCDQVDQFANEISAHNINAEYKSAETTTTTTEFDF